jgi:hypothetical protein
MAGLTLTVLLDGSSRALTLTANELQHCGTPHPSHCLNILSWSFLCQPGPIQLNYPTRGRKFPRGTLTQSTQSITPLPVLSSPPLQPPSQSQRESFIESESVQPVLCWLQPLPDALRGEKWAFVQLPLGPLKDMLKKVEQVRGGQGGLRGSQGDTPVANECDVAAPHIWTSKGVAASDFVAKIGI